MYHMFMIHISAKLYSSKIVNMLINETCSASFTFSQENQQLHFTDSCMGLNS